MNAVYPTANGLNGYYITSSVAVSASDSLSGVDRVEHNQNSAEWRSRFSIVSYDVTGNMASGSMSVGVDTVPQTITPLKCGMISTGVASALVNDAISGVSGGAEVSVDNALSWQSTPAALSDGNYSMIFLAFDVAGNEGAASLYASIAATGSESNGVHDLEACAGDLAGHTKPIASALRVDILSLVSPFTSPTSNEVASADITLGHQSSDVISGLLSVEVSTHGGATWGAATLSGAAWSHDWDTTVLQNGTYTVKRCALDMAGNRENPIPLTLLVDNTPPHVKITDSWWIWECARIHVSANGFSIRENKITINDPKGRWPSVVLTYNPSSTSSDVTWDRRFFDGTLAPSGNYRVTALACDNYGNFANDRRVSSCALMALMPAFLSSALADPRPKAIFEITKTTSQKRNM